MDICPSLLTESWKALLWGFQSPEERLFENLG